MKRAMIMRTGVSIAATAAIAAVTGIATGAAAPSKDDSKQPQTRAFRGLPPPPNGRGFGAHFRGKEPGPIGGPPVHSEIVVPNKDGDEFITVTQDSGKVDSATGDQLTITEGTKQATYKTVSIDVPSDAKVLRNGKQAELGELQAGDQVHVSQSPQKSFVFATDGDFLKKMMRHGRGMPPPPGFGGAMPGGPPPLAPPPRQRGSNN